MNRDILSFFDFTSIAQPYSIANPNREQLCLSDSRVQIAVAGGLLISGCCHKVMPDYKINTEYKMSNG